MKRHRFKTVILSDWRIILQNSWSFFFLTCYRTINSLSFPTGISYWENQIHLWALMFGSQNFPVLHVFVKYIYMENGNEFQETERGFCSQKTNIQKILSFYTQVSHIWRTKSISEPQVSAVSPNFWGKRWPVGPPSGIFDLICQSMMILCRCRIIFNTRQKYTQPTSLKLWRRRRAGSWPNKAGCSRTWGFSLTYTKGRSRWTNGREFLKKT